MTIKEVRTSYSFINFVKKRLTKDKKQTSISWEDFQSLGNPENAPKLEEEKEDIQYNSFVVRIHLEKKHRGGKTASIIRGLDLDKDALKSLTKELKKICGVGGTQKDGEIIIQGNNREKIQKHLLSLGIKDVKLAGG